VSVTSLDEKLQRVMEPRTSIPARRLAAIEKLAAAGVPVRAMVAPVIPGLTDHEMPSILRAVRDAGAMDASWVALRLPHGVKDLFSEWLERHFPDRKEKVLGRVREIRGGQLYDPTFGTRMRGTGIFADQIRSLFEAAKRKVGFPGLERPLSAAAFRAPERGGQLTLF
jgi:DNA repair photolyase